MHFYEPRWQLYIEQHQRWDQPVSNHELAIDHPVINHSERQRGIKVGVSELPFESIPSLHAPQGPRRLFLCDQGEICLLRQERPVVASMSDVNVPVDTSMFRSCRQSRSNNKGGEGEKD